jgi:bacterioferritin (cytochrome b1)
MPTPDPRMIQLMSYYRDAELHGATLLLRLIKMMDDPDAQVKLALHLADETRHAWLWTKRINDMGGKPMKIADGYQKRVGLRTVPRSLLEILALTVVVEERSFARYIEHAENHETDAQTMQVLKDVTNDEKWHMTWIRNKLVEVARQDGDESLGENAIEKYRRIDAEVYGELKAKEIEVFGDSVA